MRYALLALLTGTLSAQVLAPMVAVAPSKLPAGAIAVWDFGSYAANSTPVSVSNKLNPGTYDLTRHGFTMTGHSASFDGSSNYGGEVTIPVGTTPTFIAVASMSQAATAGLSRMLVAAHQFTVELRVNGTSILPQFVYPTSQTAPSTAIALNQWHVFTGAADGTSGTLYIDEVSKASAGANTGNVTAIQVGARSDFNAGQYWKGEIEIVVVYPRKLSAAEVTAAYRYLGDLSLSRGIVLPGANPFWFVDSANGSDSNTGTNPNAAFKTIAKLKTNDQRAASAVYLVHDSVFHEEYDQSVNNERVWMWGSGTRPLLDCSDRIAAGSWALSAGKTYSYQVSVTFAAASNATVNLWENGVQMVRVASTTLVESTPGSYTVGAYGTGPDTASPALIYMHASDGSNPGTNGQSYEYSARGFGFQPPGSQTGANLNGIWTRRNNSHDGSMSLGAGARVTNALITDGGVHSMIIHKNSIISNVSLIDGYNVPSGSSMIAANDTWASTDTITLENVTAQYVNTPPGTFLIAHGTGTLGTLAVINCSSANTKQGIEISQVQNEIVTGGSYAAQAGGSAIGGDRATVSVSGVSISLAGASTYGVSIQDGGTLGPNTYLSIAGTTITGDGTSSPEYGVYSTIASTNVSLVNSTITAVGYDVNLTIASSTLTDSGNTFGASTGFISLTGSTVASDYNTFTSPGSGNMFVYGGANKTYAQWKAIPQDAHSTP